MHTSAFSPSFIGGVPALVAHTRDFVCFCLVPGSVRLRLNAYIPKFSVYESSSCRCALKQFSKDCVDRESSPTFLNHEQKHQLIIACNVQQHRNFSSLQKLKLTANDQRILCFKRWEELGKTIVPAEVKDYVHYYWQVGFSVFLFILKFLCTQ